MSMKKLSSRPRIFVGSMAVGIRLRRFALDVFLYERKDVISSEHGYYFRTNRLSVGLPKLPGKVAVNGL